MVKQNYPWQRFWCSRDESISLADGGYLVDPTSEWGRALNPHVRPFDAIAGTRCLVLLGEPGTGKSTALHDEFTTLESHAREDDAPLPVLLNLRNYAGEQRLLDAAWSHPQVKAWTAGSGELDLFLDSYDECRLRIDTLATLILELLERLPVERLRLRIACRTGVWPGTLETALRNRFGEEHVGVYELAPLRRVDVLTAASMNGFNPTEFLREVAAREAEALATRPVTLNFLFSAKQKGGELPTSKLALYSEGCRRLASENSQHRLDAGYRGGLDTDTRLEIAARVAAATVFANRSAVSTRLESGDGQMDDLCLDELREAIPHMGVQRDAALLEVLDTGLFSSRGPSRMGWSHQTYAEFLAARYVATSGLAHDQILSLLTNSADPNARLVPQLHETAAWVATMVPGIFAELVSRDPDALLRGDVSTSGPEQRAILVQEFLAAFESDRLVDSDWGLGAYFYKLSHPSLGDQLRPYITDQTKAFIVRRTAIRIAEACHVADVQDELVRVALDPTEVAGLRDVAASAAGAVADAVHREQLRPLLSADRSQDPDDQLRGHVLEALWPDQLTAEEMFQHLHRPRRSNLYGQYKRFIREYLPPTLTETELPIALRWVLHNRRFGHSPTGVLDELADDILVRAWSSKLILTLLEDFAEIVLKSRAAHAPLVGRERESELSSLIWADSRTRRKLVVTLLTKMSDEDEVWALSHPARPLLAREDLSWLLEYILSGAGSLGTQQRAAEAVRYILDLNDPTAVNSVLEACRVSTVLHESFASWIDPVDLASPTAASMKRNHDERLRIEREQEEFLAKRGRELEPSAKRVARSLEQSENGDPDAFWRLVLQLSVEENGSGREYESDLTTLPGWRSADAYTRARIVSAAREYVRVRDPEPEKWLGTNTWFRPAFAGYKALRLAMEADPTFASTLTREDWHRWAAVIVSYPGINEQRDLAFHSTVLSTAYTHAPEEVIRGLRVWIEKEIAEHGTVYHLERIADFWDDVVSELVLEFARRLEVNIRAFETLLDAVVSRDFPPAVEYAMALVSGGPDEGSERRAIAGALLLVHAYESTWSVVRPLISAETELGRGLLRALAGMNYGVVLRVLPEQELAALYQVAVEWQPHRAVNEDDDGARWVGPEFEQARFRDALLTALKERGTFEAAAAIRGIMQVLPELDWMKYALHEAETAARTRTWEPPTPAQIFALGIESEGRLVRSARELRATIIASLRRLNTKLQDETPAAIDLWNGPDREKRYVPKDEEAFSNYVKRHLAEDLSRAGIVVNREVEIRRGEGSTPGEETDIHVSAIARDSEGKISHVLTVIIEAKGSWHRELLTAMETQLVGRYLCDNTCQDGIYLVGWFGCPQWDPNDYRRAQAPKYTLEEARKRLDAQAESLSVGGLQVEAFVMNCALRST